MAGTEKDFKIKKGLIVTEGITLGGHTFNDIDITSEASDADDHLMTALAIKNKIEDYDYIGGSIANTQVARGSSTADEIEGDNGLLFDGTSFTINTLSTSNPVLNMASNSKAISLQCETNEKLSIKGGSYKFIFDASSATSGITFPDGTTQITASGGTTGYTYTDTAGSEQFLISDNSDTSLFKIIQTGTGDALEVHDEASDTTVFKVDQSGHVQIGTTSETIGALRVKGYQGSNTISSVSTNRIARFEDGVSGNLEIASNPSNGDLYVGNGGGGNDLILFTRRQTVGYANYENIRLTSDGEIGIEGSNFGTSGQVLTSGGSGAAVSWADAASGGASAIGGLDDVLMDATNFTDGFLIQTNSDGSAPTTGTLNNALNNIGIGKAVFSSLTSGDNNIALGLEALTLLETASKNVAIGSYAGTAITSGDNNILLGYEAGNAITTGDENINIGHAAGKTSTGSSNVYIGSATGEEAEGSSNNTIIGKNAGRYGSRGDANVYLGAFAGHGNNASSTNASDFNVGIGSSVLYNISTGKYNLAMGYNAGNDITTGQYNVVLGAKAAEKMNDETGIVAVGGYALQDANGGSGALTAIGYRAGNNVTTAQQLVFVGYNAGSTVTTGNFNTLIGNNSGKKITTGSTNTGLGANSMGANSPSDMTGSGNVGIGLLSLEDLTSGSSNVAVGKSAARELRTGTYNIAIGTSALQSPTAVDYSVAIGPSTLASSSLTGAGNIAVGKSAGNDVTSGTYNVIMGYEAGDVITTGHKNITIGYQTGDNITTGSNNVVIGAADVASATGDDQLSISSGDGGVTWITGNSSGVVDIPGSLTVAGSAIGGGGISNVVEDTSPQLGANLDTNSHNIAIDDAHGILDENNNEQLIFQTTASANSYLQVWNGIADSASGTLFGNDVVHTDTDGTGRMVGPGLEATGSTTDVGMSFKTKGLGQFTFFSDETSASAAPVISLTRYVDDNQVADDDILGQIQWMGGQSSMTSPFLHDLRSYAKIEANLVDTTTGTTDGNLMLSAMVANTHTDLLEIGTNKTNDTSAGVRAFTGSMVTYSGTGTTALSRDTHAGAYVRATGAGTFTLWDNPKTGDQVVVISDHAGTTTIDGYSNDTINGAANTTITTQYNAKTFIATSSSTWIALG